MLPYLFGQLKCSLHFILLLQFELQYFHEHAGIGSSVSLNKHPVIDVSATIGTSNTVLGVEGGYDTSTGEFTKYNVGVSMIKPDFSTSVIL